MPTLECIMNSDLCVRFIFFSLLFSFGSCLVFFRSVNSISCSRSNAFLLLLSSLSTVLVHLECWQHDLENCCKWNGILYFDWEKDNGAIRCMCLCVCFNWFQCCTHYAIIKSTNATVWHKVTITSSFRYHTTMCGVIVYLTHSQQQILWCESFRMWRRL